jgi:hypothetical protein
MSKVTYELQQYNDGVYRRRDNVVMVFTLDRENNMRI